MMASLNSIFTRRMSKYVTYATRRSQSLYSNRMRFIRNINYSIQHAHDEFIRALITNYPRYAPRCQLYPDLPLPPSSYVSYPPCRPQY